MPESNYSFSKSPLGLTLQSQVSSVSSVSYGTASSPLSSLFSNSSEFTPNVSDYDSDISTVGIIEYLGKIPRMKVKNADFAYLKNLGVYPNNRLIIARRFPSPVGDDLTAPLDGGVEVSPMSTLISWVPDNTDFISATKFAEEWTEGEASFKEVLNDIGKDVLGGDNKGGSLGSFLAEGAGIVSLPGFTEGLQYEVFNKLGMTDINASNLPLGNPNLIRQSKRRTTLAKEGAGSGLTCKFTIEMTVEYEQKFINGVDPTLVYYDIIANALTFGTSESQFQFKGGSQVNDFTKFIDNLGSGNPGKIKDAMVQFISVLSEAIKKVGVELKKKFEKVKEVVKEGTLDLGAKKILDFLIGVLGKTIQGMVSKYKIRIMGVVNALTGTPSAPWHVTVGNPRRPIFSSGDMVIDGVEITMGKVLAFNDLPSSIKLKLSLTNARNLGSQEIFTKFNCGKERTYIKRIKSFVETDLPDLSKEVDAQTLDNRTKVPNSTDPNFQEKLDDATKSLPIALQNLGKSSGSNIESYDGRIAVITSINGEEYKITGDGKIFDKSGKSAGNWINSKDANGNNVVTLNRNIPLSNLTIDSSGSVLGNAGKISPKPTSNFTSSGKIIPLDFNKPLF